MSITHAACLLLGYEIVALAWHLPTWTDMAHQRRGLPVWAFVIWLVIHLARGSKQPLQAVL